MYLLIDLGNTRLKWAAVSSGVTVAKGVFAHAGVEVEAILDREWAMLSPVRRVHVASVASSRLDADLDAFVNRRFGIRADFLRSPAAALGIRNAYADPQRLGIDRFLGLAALYAAHRRAQVLIGVGTALTLDAIDAQGTHLGGWIVPSPALMRNAVLSRTARVGAADGRLVDLADNTADALYSGSLQAAAGAIERFCANAERRLKARPAVVLTGGGADEIAALVAGAERTPDLILRGLALWAIEAESPESGPRS